MVKITALKEAIKAAFKCVTTRYPLGPPTHVPPGLRGLPQFDENKCTGCGACFASCSAGAISMVDENYTRKIEISYMKCIFCGRCQDICPEKAITLSEKFELATRDKNQALVSIKFNLKKCEKCGTPITTTNQLDKIKEKILEEIDPHVKDIVSQDLPKYLNLCSECRRRMSYTLDTHTRKFYLRKWVK